ncbi:MAG: hypothetical protein K2G89_03420 [Lachnospiraceae bacterium]|nr:hypothetical protein [Lachnospiraceae bacterium]
MRKVFNLNNVFGSAVLVAMIGTIATVASEMYLATGVLLIVLAVCVFLSMKEGGQRK